MDFVFLFRFDPPPASILNEIRLHLPAPQPPTSEDALADSLGLSDEEEPEARPQPDHLDRNVNSKQVKPDQPGPPTLSLRRSGRARRPTTQPRLFPETTFYMYRCGFRFGSELAPCINQVPLYLGSFTENESSSHKF